MMLSQSKEIKAVHIADLENLLKKYDQLQEFTSGNTSCHICSDQISSANVGSIKLLDKKFVFACNKMTCYDKMVRDIQLQ